MGDVSLVVRWFKGEMFQWWFSDVDVVYSAVVA